MYRALSLYHQCNRSCLLDVQLVLQSLYASIAASLMHYLEGQTCLWETSLFLALARMAALFVSA